MRHLSLFVLAALLPTFWGCASSKPAAKSTPSAAENVTEAEVEELKPKKTPEPMCMLPDGPWPQFQGSPDRHGTFESVPIENPRIRWTLRVGVQSWLNSPVIIGNTVYVGSSGTLWNKPDGADGVYAISLDTGELAWFEPGSNDINGISYAHCKIIATSDEGVVRALDAKTGAEEWRWSPGGGKVYSNPLVLGTRVVVGDEQGRIHVLEIDTGKLQWSRDVGGAIRGGASGDSESIYVGTETGEIAAYRLVDGMQEWKSRLTDFDSNGREIYAAPTLLDDKLIVGYARNTAYDDPAVVALDPENGDVIWRGSNPDNLTGGWGNVRSSPAHRDGKLFWAEPYSNRVVSADAETGEVTWSVPHGVCLFQHWPSPAVADNVGYVARSDGGLYAFDLETGRRTWSMYLGREDAAGGFFPEQLTASSWNRCQWQPPIGKPIFASPAIAGDGTIVIGSGEGVLYAIEEDSAVE